MHEEQRNRAHEAFQTRGICQAIIANPFNVTWLTGFAGPVQAGPIPYAGGPALVWYEDGQFTLILMEGLSAPQGVETKTYPGYSFETPFQGYENLETLLRSITQNAAGLVGVEIRHLPGGLMPASPTPIDGLLEPLRQVKTAEEIVKLRQSFAVTDAGHAAAQRTLQAGMREIDVWTEIQCAVEKAAGQRVPMGNDCVVSFRDDNSGGWPLDLVIRTGDSMIVDLGVCIDGYWSDSCGTYYAGSPSKQKMDMHLVVRGALSYAISLVKPGAVASEIDRKVREYIEKEGYPAYPHHSGHGVGTSSHEEPRITPYNHTVLQPGMVIMLEPGIYIPNESAVRLEDAVLVTKRSAEVLTHHDKELP